MKANPFKHTILTAGVITALGLSGNALADVTVTNTKLDSGDANSSIENIANATYSVDGVAQIPVESNAVVVNITEKAAFSLIATNQDGTPNDQYNDQLEVVPNGVVVFNHTLKNEGNVEDTYTLTLGQNGSTPSTATDSKDYDLANTTVTYVITRANGDKETVTKSGTEFNNTKVTLAPNETVDITINGVATNNVGGDTQNLTLAAQSTYFQGLAPSDESKNTITNVDNSQTKLPVFSIIKKAANTLNLNDPNSTVDYTIEVTNAQTDYSTRATDISIIDNLPQGLKIVPGSVKVVSNPSTQPGTPNIVENSNGAGTGTNVDGFIITGVNLDVGKTVQVTFQVQKDETEEFIAKDKVINHASVEDDLDDNPLTDNTVIDSTDPDSPKQNTDQFYPPNEGDDEVTDGSTPTTPGTDSTGPLIINQRGLELSKPTTAEIPNTSTPNTQAKHETIIKNTGKEIEGDKAGELTFTITDGKENPNISPVEGPVTIEYDADGNPDTPNQTITITPTIGADGIPVYDINSALPGGMAPGSTVTIKYDVKSDKAVTGTKETTVVTLIPGGTDAPPAPAPVVDTTNVKGLELVKEQALQTDCKTPVIDTAFSKEPINAVKPGQCIVYRITATNGFDNLNMTDVLIYDTTARFDGKAIYKDDGSISVGAGSTASNPVVKNASNPATGGDAIYTTVNTLAAQDKAVLKFSVQIDPTGAAQ